MTERPILRLGTLAHATLSPGSQGRVLAANSRAVFLICSDGCLLWLTDHRSTPHRRFLQVASSVPPTTQGSNFHVQGSQIRTDAGWTFELAGALVWRPEPKAGWSHSAGNPYLRFRSAATALASLPKPMGFGVLLPSILSLVDRPSHFAPTISSPAAARAWPLIRDVVEFSRGGDLPTALARCEELIGLGEGLTPSGDDFVGAYLYWLGSVGQLEATDVSGLVVRSRRLTNLVSYTLLVDHVHGHSSEALQSFVDALRFAPNTRAIRDRATGLISLGHSTGWDLLAGIMVGLIGGLGASKFQRRAPRRSVSGVLG